MSRSTAQRLATHGAVGVVLAVLLYLLLSATSGTPNPGTQAPAATQAALQPPPVVETPLAVPRPVPHSPSPTPSVPLRTIRVGIQVGHWLTDEVPDELSRISTVEGVKWEGLDETVINEQIANRLSELLVDAGIHTDILPTTVPEGYTANLFLALHADAYKDSEMRGFKVARSAWSDNPERDDSLVAELIEHYGGATGLPEHRDTITDAMTEYYAFNYSEFRHSISPTTPAAIIEMGFLSNEGDRQVLVEDQQSAAQGIANAVLDFLMGLP